MFEEVLRKVGLTPNEAKLYEALLHTEKANVSTLAIKAKVHRRNVYDCINKLVEKGLISEIIVEGEKFYKAVHPQHLLALIKEKEDVVATALPAMVQRFQNVETKEYVSVYKGVAGFRNYLQDILQIPDGEDCFYVGAKLGWFDPRLRHLLPRFKKISREKKLMHYHLFDKEVEEKHPEIIQELVSLGAPYKILPKKYSTTSAIDIFGDYVVTFSGLHVKQLDDDLTQFVLVSKELADAYKIWFKFMWNSLPGKKFK